MIIPSVKDAKQQKKKKYIVNIMFDLDWENAIRSRAKEKGLTVAGYIKTLVSQDLNDKKELE